MIFISDIDCKLTGSEATYQNGIYFNDTKGVSTYYCNHGIASKQGCNIEGKWALVGEVVYTDSGEVFLCDNSVAGYTSFNGLKGCVSSDGSAKKFQEVWQEGNVMKRCSWTYSGSRIADSKVLQYACVRDSQVIPEFKILQKYGKYEKCARNEKGDLEIRYLTAEEVAQHEKRKTKRIDLREFFAAGGRGALESINSFNDSIPFLGNPPTSEPSPPTTSEASIPPTSGNSALNPEPSAGSPTSEGAEELGLTPSTSELQIFIGDQNPNTKDSLPVEGVQMKEENNEETETFTKNESCVDSVPFCAKLASYCSDFEKYQVVDGHADKSSSGTVEELQQLNIGSPAAGLNIPHRQISPCEARKFSKLSK